MVSCAFALVRLINAKNRALKNMRLIKKIPLEQLFLRRFQFQKIQMP